MRKRRQATFNALDTRPRGHIVSHAETNRDELEAVILALHSRRRMRPIPPTVVKDGVARGWLAEAHGHVILTLHGQLRAQELVTPPE